MASISVILPTRERPEALAKALASLTAGVGDEVEVIVGVDSDDPKLDQYMKIKYPGTRVMVIPTTPTVGALFNELARHATGNWFIPFPDDYTMEDRQWSHALLEGVKKLPSDLGVAYLRDLHYPGFTTFPVVSRRMIEINGFFMPEFFPFLFGDTWWNEIGNLTGVKHPIATRVKLEHDHGNEHRYRDFVLWAMVFEKTRPMRIQAATAAIREMFNNPSSREGAWLVTTMENRAEMCKANQAHMFEEWFVEKWDNTDPRPPSARYLACKTKAEKFLTMQF